MDVPLLIKQRLNELNLDQKELAAAAQVTESYISQLLARKKAPPAPGRTDIYEKIGKVLGLPSGELARVAEAQRQLEMRRKASPPPGPLFKDCRDLILRKCDPNSRPAIRQIFEKEAFGELERLVTQKVLDVAQGVAREELRNEDWLQSMARLSQRSFEQMRVAILEFMDTDAFQVSIEGCVTFLDPIIDTWDIDLKTFAIEIILNPRLAPASVKRFEFLETVSQPAPALEPGLEEFLHDRSLSGDVTEEEIQFLRSLRFYGRRPNSLYYYRELQNWRDPIHFYGPASTM
jgi:transcriptional regulator with XRE-family HTH domain